MDQATTHPSEKVIVYGLRQSMEMIGSLLINTCSIMMISAVLKKIGNGILKFFETTATSRAATELIRQGYHKEAKALMMGLKK